MRIREVACTFVAVASLACSTASRSVEAAGCPDLALGETIQDCPWAAIARKGDLSVEAANGLREQWKSDRTHPELLALWGLSINFDELAKGVIVAPEILRQIGKGLDLTVDSERIVHAGLEHTYGYLFSLLKTPFGYKRARWVSGEIDRGFGLHTPAISPSPAEGTLLANASGLAAGIALGRVHPAAHPEIRALEFAKMKGRRLVETVKLGKRTVRLRTDLVEFPIAPELVEDQPAPNTTLLVYSIEDSSAPATMLVTLFPVQTGFAAGVFAKEKLGPDQEISTRYNAHVEGLTGKPARGDRREVKWPADSK